MEVEVESGKSKRCVKSHNQPPHRKRKKFKIPNWVYQEPRLRDKFLEEAATLGYDFNYDKIKII